MLMSSIRDWDAMLRRCWEHLQPEGWIEILDFISPYRAEYSSAENAASSAFIRWGYRADEAFEANGTGLRNVDRHVARLQDAGVRARGCQVVEMAAGRAAREQSIGKMTLRNMMAFFKTAAPAILGKHPRMSEEEAKEASVDAETDLVANCDINRYFLTV